MKIEPVKIVHVSYQPHSQKISMGRLAIKERKIYFEYDPSFISAGLELSPFTLPLKSGVIASPDLTFDGLFGIFNDSLPDGWGRLLLDRALIKHNLNPAGLSLLDRLCLVGKQGMGALIYEPETTHEVALSHQSLDAIADEMTAFQEHDDEAHLEELLNLGGSSAGARPKALLNIDNTDWLIKFPSSTDPKDIGAIEFAYHLMAKEAGLDVPLARLFPSKKGKGFFGCQRFDKDSDKRVHMHTISGLLHVDHRTPSLDYETIMRATLHLTRDIRECEKQFRACVFNVLTHNRDDHAKNFSFLMEPDGTWHVSPSYDLTFSSGPNGEHCTMVMGEGKQPSLSSLLSLSTICDMKLSDARTIIDEVKASVMKWPTFAKEAGVSPSSMRLIQSVIEKIIKAHF